MKTITYDESIYKVVPIEPTDDMLYASGKVDDLYFANGTLGPDDEQIYSAMLAAVPDTLPSVVAHSGEPCAYANGDDILSMRCGNAAPIALSAAQSGWHKTPLFTHPPAQPDTAALQVRVAELAIELQEARASEIARNRTAQFFKDERDAANRIITKLESQLAAQAGRDEWRDIGTLPYSDDLVWLKHGDTIEGPRSMCTDDCDQYSEWAPCTWPRDNTAPPAPTNSIAIVPQPRANNLHVAADCESFTHWIITAPDGRQWTGETAMKAFGASRKDTVDPVVAMRNIKAAIDEQASFDESHDLAIVQSALEAAANILECGSFLHAQLPQAIIAKSAANAIRAINPKSILDGMRK